ncbi:hypothetical protein [Gluconobacter sphaericus]|uniref:hypothetical protein n=1 Tax=Gluconobacter sphaericus TaxID=574987 RepID=UPI00312B86D6
MSGPTDLNSPLPAGKICNADGSPTVQFQAFIRRLWERTGYSPGNDSLWTAAEADIASLAVHASSIKADNAQQAAEAAQSLTVLRTESIALVKAQEALEAAYRVLLNAQAFEAKALKTLETAQKLAMLLSTASPEAQAAQSQNESMMFSVMNRPWPSSHNPS